jgi:endoglucanase
MPSKLHWRGVSLSGPESEGPNQDRLLPGTEGEHYVYPMPADARYFKDKGMTLIRLPFLWERLQPVLGEPLNAAELARLDSLVNAITDAGLQVLLDPHNYARYVLPDARAEGNGNREMRGSVIGSSDVSNADFADFWARLASAFKSNGSVSFGLMNEPHGIAADQWVGSANAAIEAIRRAGAANVITVPGSAWSGAHSWTSPQVFGGISNAVAMRELLRDPQLVIEVHQYLDAHSAGKDASCPDPTAGVRALEKVTGWLESEGRRGFLGEFGGAANPPSKDAIRLMLEHMEANAPTWQGWAWWGAGEWLDELFQLRPGADGADRPQLQWLEPYLL